MERLVALKQSCETDLKKLKNVAGVGLGYKWVNGVPTEQPAIIVFVERKIKRGTITKFAYDLVPEEIDGIPTDVIEVGHVIKQNFMQHVRPIKPGYSTGHGDITCGTIGGFFIDKDGDYVALSNNHVFANENRSSVGDLIFQPGPSDQGGAKTFNGWDDAPNKLPYFATLKGFAEIKESNNTHDSAIAKVHPSFIEAGMVDLIYPTMNSQMRGIADPQANASVQKAGRTTGYTTGRIISVNASFTISYDFGDATFDDCVVCTAMSKGGDSGSIIFDMSMNAVALLFAGSPKVTIANPMKKVANHYGLKVIDSIGPTVTLDDGKWTMVRSTGEVLTVNGGFTINCHANNYCYMKRPIGAFRSIEVSVNTGTDRGASWGPSLTLEWPNNTFKVNLRHGGSFCGSLNNNQNLGIGKVQPNTDYKLRIAKTNSTYVGEVFDNGSWHKVIEIPFSVLPSPPINLIIGKTDEGGRASNHTEPGEMGQCTFSNLVIN